MPMDCQADLDDYLSHLLLERRLSARTIQAYRDDLSRFLSHCQEDGYQDYDQITPDAVRGLIAREHRRGQSGGWEEPVRGARAGTMRRLAIRGGMGGRASGEVPGSLRFPQSFPNRDIVLPRRRGCRKVRRGSREWSPAAGSADANCQLPLVLTP